MRSGSGGSSRSRPLPSAERVAWGASVAAPGVYEKTASGGFTIGRLGPNRDPDDACRAVGALLEAVEGRSQAAGREVIINARPVELAGRPRHGWWERDRATGRVIGVMDDGRHGAMTEYSLKGEKLGLSDDTGMIIGLIVGEIGRAHV